MVVIVEKYTPSVHNHQMIPVENIYSYPILPCFHCKLPISSNQFYKCNQLYCTMKLHKSCNNTELPSEIIHSCHPNHPLILEEQLMDSGSSRCALCDDTLSKHSRFYRCSTTTCRSSFKIDIVCALLPGGFKIEHQSHPQHPLLPTIEEALFFCHACGTTHHDRPLICNCCGFWIGRSCAQLPSTLAIDKNDSYQIHHHPLQLKYSHDHDQGSGSAGSSSSDDDDFAVPCRICAQPINRRFWIYCCEQCRYFVHQRCARSTTEPFISILHPARSPSVDFVFKNTIQLPVKDTSTNIVGYLLGNKRSFDPHDSPKDPRGHRLILHTNIPTQNSNVGSSNVSLCNGCIQPIFPPFYSCRDTKCSLLVHKKCYYTTDLWDTFTDIMRLTILLLPRDHRMCLNLEQFFGIFHCDACHRPSNGFESTRMPSRLIFVKDEVLDLKCALAPKFIIPESHPKHRLILDKRTYGPCPCCLLAGEVQGKYIYRCETCSFNLHRSYANYPSMIRHRYDKHPLALTYKPIKGCTSDECYCEICEMELNRHGWFYHYNECDQFFHPTCIPQLDHLSNIKFGGTRKIICHFHSLTLDRFILDRLCKYCNKVIDSTRDGMAFQCKKCPKYQIHFECAQLVSLAEGQNIRETILDSWDTGNPFSEESQEVDCRPWYGYDLF